MPYIPSKRPNLGKAQIVNQKFQNIRGVDFTTQTCKPNRSPDMQNMYRDWWANGDCLVMMAGFRVVGDFESAENTDNRILGVHFFKAIIEPPTPETPEEAEDEGEEIVDETQPAEEEDVEEETLPMPQKEVVQKVIVHQNGKLYEWLNFEDCVSPKNWETPIAPEYKEIYDGMSLENKSKSVIFENKMYVIDGENWLVYDGETAIDVHESPDVFVPTTYIARTYAGGGTLYQQRNLLCDKFKNLARGDGSTDTAHKTFALSEKNLDAVIEVKVNDEVLEEETDYTVDLEEGTVTFKTVPPAPMMSGADNIEFTISKHLNGDLEKVTHNREIAIFDSRVFLTGNKDAHNDIRWSQLNRPDYFGQLNYATDGKGASPVMNLIKVGTDTLCAIKADTQQDGVVYYHTPMDMADDYIAKQYPSKCGVAGIGAISHFGKDTLNDDPLFLTREGVKAIGKLSYGLERSIEHRSSYVDSRMRNERNPEDAVSCVWRGYYCVLFPSGNMYLADSRMKTEVVDSQSVEYEWFFANDIGVYAAQEEFDVVIDSGKTVQEALDAGDIVSQDWESGERYYWKEDFEKWQAGEITEAELKMLEVPTVKEMRGGEFQRPICLFEYENSLYFTTENGKVCKYNTDMVKNQETGELRVYAFNNNGRKINAYYCTPLHDYGAFNMLKRFDKKGNVLHTQTFRSGWVRLSVRTNKSYWNPYKRQNAGYFDYSDWDYGDMTYNTFDIIALIFRKLKEKKWQVAQIKLENAKINSAFGIYELDIRVRMLSLVKR